ncbi:hypothetical protein QBC47DRAFT_414784 [Echria macrotheca]|uniref:Uncharacterized protein n=1 Tax=Echria macrotheca TaxID=438768 RepID=A0AAJ0FA51_9PEZI|nr:hypothetical protein QBC47DRAFT_414784 [Echria macrotheca]
MTILAPKDMETAPSSMGYYEIRIAGLVSTISLLPLPIPVLLLSSQSMSKDRHPYRLSVLHFTVVPSVYPFLSQSIRYWAPTTIGEYRGEGGETYVTNEEWGALLDLCFEGGDGYAGAFTPAEHVVLGVFHMLAFVAVLLFSVLLLVPLILRRVDARNGGVRGPMRERIGVLVERAVKSGGRTWVRILLALVPLGLAVPLLWGFWRLRGVQSRLAVAAKGHYEGNDWGFGQVMAIAVFVPVGAEMLFVWAQMRGERRTKAEMSEQARMEKCGLQSSELVRKLEEPRIDGQGRDRINTSPW